MTADTPARYPPMSEVGSSASKRPINMSVRPDLLEAARGAGVNLSALLERALIEELAHQNRQQWRAESLMAISAYNEHLLRHGTWRVAARSARGWW